jgi:hypothetical protein
MAKKNTTFEMVEVHQHVFTLNKHVLEIKQYWIIMAELN